jgi:hypothetical protein
MHRERTVTTLAAALWTVLGVAIATGCVQVTMPIVEQDVTTGEKLRAIARGERGEAVGELPAVLASDDIDVRSRSIAASKELRAQLLASPPDMRAWVSTWDPCTSEQYSIFNPGLYAPQDRERMDLHRALEAGVVSRAEYDELWAIVGQQERRSVVRHGFELPPVAMVGSVTSPALFVGGQYEERTEAARKQWVDSNWIARQITRQMQIDETRRMIAGASGAEIERLRSLLAYYIAKGDTDGIAPRGLQLRWGDGFGIDPQASTEAAP